MVAYEMGILTLTEDIVATPAILWGNSVSLGSLGVMVGYGNQADGNGDPINWGGITQQQRLAATNIIDVVVEDFLATDFDSKEGTTSSVGNTVGVYKEGSPCLGDSGGPLYINGNVIAIAHGGSNSFGSDCGYGTLSQWTLIGNPKNIQFLHGQGLFVESEPSDMLLFIVGLIAIRIRLV